MQVLNSNLVNIFLFVRDKYDSVVIDFKNDIEGLYKVEEK